MTVKCLRCDGTGKSVFDGKHSCVRCVGTGIEPPPRSSVRRLQHDDDPIEIRRVPGHGSWVLPKRRS